LLILDTLHKADLCFSISSRIIYSTVHLYSLMCSPNVHQLVWKNHDFLVTVHHIIMFVIPPASQKEHIVVDGVGEYYAVRWNRINRYTIRQSCQ
jgi:hypothetical protein